MYNKRGDELEEGWMGVVGLVEPSNIERREKEIDGVWCMDPAARVLRYFRRSLDVT
jgi:hypothetical protein